MTLSVKTTDFSDVRLYQYIWKTTSWDYQNLVAVFERFFQVYTFLRSVFISTLRFCTIPGVIETHLQCVSMGVCGCLCVCMLAYVLTIHVQPLHDDGELHLAGHVTQGAHGHAQLLLGDESIAIAVEHTECLTDLCTWTQQQHILVSLLRCKRLLFSVQRTTWHAQFQVSETGKDSHRQFCFPRMEAMETTAALRVLQYFWPYFCNL